MYTRSKVELLGGLRIEQGAEAAPRVITRFRTQKTAALLAYLAYDRDRLAEAYLQSLHQLVALLERAGDLDRALGYARRAVSADSLREEGHHDVMRLLAAAGQPAAALCQYRHLEQLLEEQIGAEPS